MDDHLWSEDEEWDEVAKQVKIPKEDLWSDDEAWEQAAIAATRKQENRQDEFSSSDDEQNPNGKRSLSDRREKVFLKRCQRGRGIRQTGVEPRLTFELVKEFQPRNIDRFKCQIYKKVFKAKHNFNEVDILFVGNKIDEMFMKFLEDPLQLARDQDQVSVSITNDKINKPIFVSYKKKNFDIKELVNKMSELTQSETGQSFVLTREFEVEVAITRYTLGGARKTTGRNKAPKDATELSKRKVSVTEIRNEDNACGYWAISLARLKAESPSKAEWDQARKNRCDRLKRLAQELCTEAGVDYDNKMDLQTMKLIDVTAKTKVSIDLHRCSTSTSMHVQGRSCSKTVIHRALR